MNQSGLIFCSAFTLENTYTICRDCYATKLCRPLVTCCSYNATYGPMEIVGIDADDTLVVGDVYFESTTSNKCVTVLSGVGEMYMGTSAGLCYDVDLATGICTQVNQGGLEPAVNVDVAVDRNGNLIQSDGSQLGWSNPFGPTSYVAFSPVTISTSMDFDYSNRLVACEYNGGISTWNISTIDLAGTVLSVSSWVEANGIDVGMGDLVVLHSTGNYMITGDTAGGGGSNNLYEINALGHLLTAGPFNLTVTLSLNVTDVVIGLENIATNPSELYVLVNEPTANPNINYIKIIYL